jgi:hypothetical protein
MEVQVAGHGIALDLGEDWAVGSGWHDAALQATHGIYLSSIAHGLEVHVRSLPVADRELTASGLLELLRSQNWGGLPSDEVTLTNARQISVAGTFTLEGGDQVVREWFATDGRALANAAAVGTRAQLEHARSAVERLFATIRFG